MKVLKEYIHEAVLLVVLIVLMTVIWFIDPSFLTANAQAELSTHVWQLALLAIPMTMIIVTGGIDLSIGSTMALAAVTLGLSYKAGISPWIGSLMALVVATAAGWLNGVFVAKVKVLPLIVTLATMSAYRGIAEGVSKAAPVSGFPAGFAVVGQGYDKLIGLPWSGWVFIAAFVLALWVWLKTPFGTSLTAIGHNESAARFSGLPIARLKTWIYTISGFLAGIAAVQYVSLRNTAKADIGTGMELDVITAVVLGGSSVTGGRGNLLGTLLGVILIHEVREFVSWYWQSDELNLLVIGSLLIISVLLNSFLNRKSR
ncbi:MAG: ABC transporter permease [Armatimonadota bacterium]